MTRIEDMDVKIPHTSTVGTLGHLNVDGITKASEVGIARHLTANVHFVLFAHFKGVDCVPGVSLRVQLQVNRVTFKKMFYYYSKFSEKF